MAAMSGCIPPVLNDIAGLRGQIAAAREVVDVARERDLRRGIQLMYILAVSSFWLLSLALLVYLAHRISRPIQQLTRGLTELFRGRPERARGRTPRR